MAFASVAVAAAMVVGCGSSGPERPAAKSPPAPHEDYVRELKVAIEPLDESGTMRMVNRTTSAGEYRRAAVAFERYLPELRAYLRRLEAVEPPPGCAYFQRQLERVQRASIRIFTGALPLYRRADDALLRDYMLEADRILKPMTASLRAPSDSDRLPCYDEERSQAPSG